MKRGPIKIVALFEACKGFIALVAASGLLLLVHKDLHEFAMRLVEHAHLNPAAKYPNIFIKAATHLQNLHLVFIAVGAATYSVVRFIEAYGLLREAAWAEIFAAVSGAIYLPFEIVEAMRRFDALNIGTLVFNIAVVAIMLIALRQRRAAGRG